MMALVSKKRKNNDGTRGRLLLQAYLFVQLDPALVLQHFPSAMIPST
jgi:hypothetical protein